MSGTPERGNRGGDPAAIARAAAVIWVSGRAMERPAMSASRAPDQQREQRGADHRRLRPAHDLVHLPQVRGDPDRAGPAGHGDVQQRAAHRLAVAGGDADPARRARSRTSGRSR